MEKRKWRGGGVWVMAHFTAAGFYLPVNPQDHWSGWIKARQTSRDPLTAVMKGRGPGDSAPRYGDRGENPREVPVWRENHVKATDGSLRGLCKKGQKSRWLSTANTLCVKAFEGISVDHPPLLLFMPSIHLQCLKCCVDSKIRRWIDPKEQISFWLLVQLPLKDQI